MIDAERRRLIHDMNTPLQIIASHADLLALHSDEDVRLSAQAVLAAVARITVALRAVPAPDAGKHDA